MRALPFLAGSVLVAIGVGLHAADYLGMEEMGYRMAGMPASPSMHAGMAALAAGLAVASVSLVGRAPAVSPAQRIARFEAERVGGPQLALLVVAVLALAIDVMKPATIGFVLPGMREEYGLSKPEAGVLGLVGLTGTAVGSLLWGALADRVGRRPAILLSALLFIATSVCGAMPSFTGNLVMCFVMGASAGGLLPVLLTLLAETMPRRVRAFAVVLVSSLGATGGYLLAAGGAALLEPLYSWRVLWLIGAPTGLALAVLQRFVPESPRFLLLRGRHEEADRVMRRFSLRAVSRGGDDAPGARRARGREVLARRYRALTIALLLYAFSWGLVNFGFFTWLPTMFADVEDLSSAGEINALLATAALIALPSSLAIAWLYDRWSTKRSLVAAASVGAGALVAAGLAGGGDGHATVAVVALVLLIASINAMNAMVLPYASECYPTELRGRGTGLIAGAGKVGGIVGVQVVSGLLILVSGPLVAALALAGPLLLSVALLTRFTTETRDSDLVERRLAADMPP